MKKIVLTLASCFLSLTVMALEMPLSNGMSIENKAVKDTCRFSGALKKDNNRIVQAGASATDSVLLDFDGDADFELVNFFDIDKDGYCELILGYGKGDVNEVYRLFVNRNNGERFVKSNFSTAYNPDIKADSLHMVYRDGARTNIETLCYSKVAADFYLCRKEVAIDSGLSKVIYLSENGSRVKTEILAETRGPASMLVMADRAYFGELSDDFTFRQKKSYLIKGDRVFPIDYAEQDDDAWFKVVYKAGKTDVTGWIQQQNFE